jgi:adenylate cyclase class 2
MDTNPDDVDRRHAFLEIEAKFFVPELASFRQHALNAGASSISARTLERNWRFDWPDRTLHAAGQLLRLRQDSIARLTLKGPAASPAERREVELVIDDAEIARHLLEDLGFVCVLYYEKQREVLQLDAGRLMLDEMPFGSFVEIEADDVPAVRRVAERLGLRWEARVQKSYAELIAALQSDPKWSAPAGVFTDGARAQADAGATLHLERAWSPHA